MQYSIIEFVSLILICNISVTDIVTATMMSDCKYKYGKTGDYVCDDDKYKGDTSHETCSVLSSE